MKKAKTTTKKETTKKVTNRAEPYKAPSAPEALAQAIDPDQADKKKFRVQCMAGMLTYNEVLIETKEDLEKMREELKAKFKHEVDFSLCLEKEARLHVHVFFDCKERVDCDLQYFATSNSGPVSDFKANRGGNNIARGHYYCQCVWKKSHIECVFDCMRMPTDFWLMMLWRQKKIKDEKITEALATEGLLKPQLEQQILRSENLRKKIRIQETIKEREERVDKQIVPFVPIDSVEEWKISLLDEKRRYKFLVLEGGSYMRKTEFAKSLFKNYFRHKDAIDWSEYDWEENGSIIFDDVSQPMHIWEYVKKNKILFTSSSFCAVNISSTNCYKMDVCVVQKPIIVCTNDSLTSLHEQYIDWIKQNSVWITVNKAFRTIEEIDPNSHPL